MQVEVQKLTAAASCVAVVTGAKLAGVTASGMLQARSAMTNYRSFLQSCQQLCVHVLEISSPVPIPSVVFKKYPQARPPVIVSGFIASTRLTATMKYVFHTFVVDAMPSTSLPRGNPLSASQLMMTATKRTAREKTLAATRRKVAVMKLV